MSQGLFSLISKKA